MAAQRQDMTPRQTPAGFTTPIKVGGRRYLVNIDKMEYFRAMLRFEQMTAAAGGRANAAPAADAPAADSAAVPGDNNPKVPEHGPIPFFGVINDAVNGGWHLVFALMRGKTLDKYRALCASIDYLTIDPLDGATDLLQTFLSLGVPTGRRYRGLTTARLAAAFVALYALVQRGWLTTNGGNDDDGQQHQNSVDGGEGGQPPRKLAREIEIAAFGMVCAKIVEHRMYGADVRQLFRRAYEERFGVAFRAGRHGRVRMSVLRAVNVGM